MALKCGDCAKWMCSSLCPQEKNVNGRNEGPSCNGRICSDFTPQDNYDEAPQLKQGVMDKREYKGVTMSDEAVYDEVQDQPTNLSVMENVAAMAKSLKDAADEAKKAEEVFKAANERLRILQQETIPQYFNTLGIAELKLSTGETVSVVEKLTCSQVKDEKRLKEAYRWLDAHDGAYLIKKKLEVEELNAAFTDDLKKMGYVEGEDFMVKENVNTASLKSYLSEKLGRKSAIASISFADVPKEFGLFIYNEVTIK